MIQLFLYGTLTLVLLAAAFRLLALSLPEETRSDSAAKASAGFFPVHCRYFPQMRQLFSSDDAAFMAERGSRGLLRRWKAERKRAARMYLRSLGEDFAGLNRLARTLARYSSHLEAGQQAQVIWLNLRFHLLYRVALLQVLAGLSAGPEFQRIARLVGSFSGQLEKAAFTLDSSSGALTP